MLGSGSHFPVPHSCSAAKGGVFHLQWPVHPTLSRIFLDKQSIVPGNHSVPGKLGWLATLFPRAFSSPWTLDQACPGGCGWFLLPPHLAPRTPVFSCSHHISGCVQRGLSFSLTLGFLLRIKGHSLIHCVHSRWEFLPPGKMLSSMCWLRTWRSCQEFQYIWLGSWGTGLKIKLASPSQKQVTLPGPTPISMGSSQLHNPHADLCCFLKLFQDAQATLEASSFPSKISKPWVRAHFKSWEEQWSRY